MPDWPMHLIVPLLALFIVSKKEDIRYILLLLPLAVVPDIDTFATQHRALLHNIFIPLTFLLFGFLVFKGKRTIFMISSVYLASHVVLDMFGGGVALLYPLYDEMTYVNASLVMGRANDLIWTLDFGSRTYDTGWKTGYGFISDSPGTGAMVFLFLAGVGMAYRNWIKEEHK
ncbi:LexA-binding, inner membrane-associated putative hydrolase [uncultured archaeon]|nr:LexA-binding, inner membrane-associated putative hydrolase [uncultured archaeon]